MRSGDSSRLTGDSADELYFVQQRRAPRMFIADRHGALLFCCPDLANAVVLERSREAVRNFFARGHRPDGPVFEPLDPGTMLRIVPLAGERPDCYAVFVEPLSSRNYLDAAVKRYDITKREAEVLELLIGGFSTLEVAERLYITEGTVGDHVKSLFRKTRANKRSELVARVFQPDWPEAPRHRDRTKSEARVPGLMIVAHADRPETSRP